jgi:hypothetical protein
MTDLLSAAARRTPSVAGGTATGRPVVLTAVVAGAVSAGSMLLVTMAAALAGWFAADAGRYGDTRDAMRVGADAWLLAHGADLHLDTTTVTVLPLGLTLVCAYVTYRVGVWAGETAVVDRTTDHLGVVLSAAGLQATVYAVVALLAAVLSIHPRAEADLMGALVGGFVLALLAGGAGLLVGTGQVRPLLARAPARARSVLAGAGAVVLLTLAAGSFLVAGALVADFGTAATVLSRLHLDGPTGLSYTAVGLLFVPNAALLAGSYLLGPGFAVGTGTVVSPTAVMLGPVPAFPLLAALPDDGGTPAWTTALIGAPVLLALLGVMLAARLAPVERLDTGALTGLLAGLLAAVAFTGLVVLAGGAVGPGRMADVGAPGWSTLLAAAVSFGGGGLLGGLLGAWRSRRRAAGGVSNSGGVAG